MPNPIEVLKNPVFQFGATVASGQTLTMANATLSNPILATTGAVSLSNVTVTNTATFKGMARITGTIPPRVDTTSLATQWAGFITVASGVSTATLSSTSVKSNSIVLATAYSDTASNVQQVIVVRSRAEAAYVGFTITPAPVGTDFTFSVILINPA